MKNKDILLDSQTIIAIRFGSAKKEKYATQVKNNKKYQEMIDILKQDIADYEKRNQKETAEKLNEIWKEQ